jgi:putative tryptophan/tyrosine transport system substrate-binding protein
MLASSLSVRGPKADLEQGAGGDVLPPIGDRDAGSSHALFRHNSGLPRDLPAGTLMVRQTGRERKPVSMRRRDFITLLGGVGAAWPLAASAQDLTVPLIGFLNSASPGPFARLVDAFRRGLREGGYVEGRNVRIEYRWAEGEFARLPELAADLVNRRVSLIVATGGTVSARAAKEATATIPMLFIGGPDPIGDGLVTSLNRPGGNATGVALYTSELLPKRLELLGELLPRAATIALLVNPSDAAHEAETKYVEDAMQGTGRQMVLLGASAERDFEPAIVSAVQQRADALLVSASPFFTQRRVQLVALAARHAIPAGYPWREYTESGGLMSYGPSIAGAYHLIGRYASRILNGEKPTDLPVQGPTSYELVINLKTAKALGLEVPPSLLAVADGVIE